jgi:hypothetical protein
LAHFAGIEFRQIISNFHDRRKLAEIKVRATDEYRDPSPAKKRGLRMTRAGVCALYQRVPGQRRAECGAKKNALSPGNLFPISYH